MKHWKVEKVELIVTALAIGLIISFVAGGLVLLSDAIRARDD